MPYGHLNARTRAHYPHFNIKNNKKEKKNITEFKSIHKILQIIVFCQIKIIQSLYQKSNKKHSKSV